jgi:hypothetical protein
VADGYVTSDREAEIRFDEAQRIRESIAAAFDQERAVLRDMDAYHESDIRVAQISHSAMLRALKATRS